MGRREIQKEEGDKRKANEKWECEKNMKTA